MKARGKREARRPWSSGNNLNGALKGRNIDVNYFALSVLHRPFGILPGATRFAVAPWLSYYAPLALSTHIAAQPADRLS